MTQSPSGRPPNDSTPDSGRKRTPATGPTRPLSFDEMVALFVAFLSLGGVLLWGLTRGQLNLLDGASAPVGPIVSSVEEAPEVAIAGEVEDDVAIVNAPPAGSARSELAAQAAARRERLATRKPIWDDLRDGAVGTAAGVTGAAVIADAVEDTPDSELSAAAIDADNTPESNVPDIGTAIPSEAARAEAQDAVEFNDVASDYWAKPYIDALSSRGLISGYEDGSFKPNDPVTRAQIANIVSRTFDLTVEAEDFPFSDVPSDNWARESISEVVQGGFMTGFPDDTFDPNANVTRAQALTTLVTGLGIETPTNIQASLDSLHRCQCHSQLGQ